MHHVSIILYAFFFSKLVFEFNIVLIGILLDNFQLQNIVLIFHKKCLLVNGADYSWWL